MVRQQLEGGVDRGRSGAASAALGFRVRLGVTGHRRLPDEDRVRAALVDRLAYVQRWFDRARSTRLTFSVMTALAEGTDRLVAREARGVFGQAHIELEAVLPLTVEDYLEDFAEEPSREEFHELLRGAATRVLLADAPKPPGPERNEAYANAGRYIVDRCDVLIAVWDGLDARGVGGTAEIVRYAREQRVPVLVVPASSEAEAAGSTTMLDASLPRLRAWLETCHHIDEYNRRSLPARLLDRTERSAYEPLEAVYDLGLMRSQLDRVSSWALPRLARADAFALHYQVRYTLLARAVHLLALMAVIAVGAQIVFARSTPEWLFVEVGALLALLVVVWAGRRGRTHDSWIGYRSLAEAFRSAFFLLLTGASEQREDELPHLDPAELPWPQRAFSEAWRHHPPLAYDEAVAPQLRDFLLRAWIGAQIAYHREAAERYDRSRSRYTRGISILAVITIGVATIHILAVRNSSTGASWLEFLAIVLPGIGAAITGLREHGQHRVHQDRSKRTITRLERLTRPADPRPTLASVRRLAVEVHQVMVEENQDWWGVIEFQDIELVI